MSTKNSDAAVRACVDSFVSELSALIRQATLDSLQEALGMVAPARRGPGRPRKAAGTATTKRKAPARKKRERRSSADVGAMTDKAAAYIASNPGCSISDIGAALGVTTKDLRLPMQKLLADRKVKTTGQKRGTRYHAGKGGASAKRGTKKKAAKKRASKRKATRKKAGSRRKKAGKK